MIKYIQQNKITILLFTIYVFFFLYHLVLYKNADISTYPFLHQDFWKRMQDSLFFAGEYNDPSFHPPLPSLLWALQYKLTGSTSFYWLNILIFILTSFSIFKIAKYISKNNFTSAIIAIFFLFNFQIIYHANFVGLVDIWAACLINFSILYFLRFLDTKNYRFLFWANIIAGIGSLIQYSGIFILITFIVILWYKNKYQKENYDFKKIHKYLIASSIFLVTFFVCRTIFFGNPLYSRVEHLGFFRLHFEDIGFYLWKTIVYTSIPIIFFAVVGMYNFFKVNTRKFYELTAIYSTFFIFFTLFYVWDDIRFVIYWVSYFYIFASFGIEQFLNELKNKWIFPVVVILMLVYVNLHTKGMYDIVVTPVNDITLTDLRDERNDMRVLVAVPEIRNDVFLPYFIYQYDLINGNKMDDTFYYYKNTLNPEPVIGASKFIKENNLDKVAFNLDEEFFVRREQFRTFSLREIPSGMTIKPGKRYVVSDKDLNFKIIYSNYKYKIYDIESND